MQARDSIVEDARRESQPPLLKTQATNLSLSAEDSIVEEPKLDHKANPNLDVLAYWKENRERYPELSLMARDVLSIPITTVASESSFSIGGHIIGKFQSSILPANVEAKLCARDWLCGQEDCDGSDTDEDEIAVELQPYLAKLGSH